MKNPEVGRKESEEIRKLVKKVLRGLGNPEPPLDLRNVRDLLKLDLRYYSSTDTSFLQDTISRLKIAGKQLAMRPSLLLDVVRKANISALWVPDHKRILIDTAAPKLKHRWSEAHEVTHSLAPWHQRFLFGDNSESLKQSCHDTLESEANYGAGQLLFMQDRFVIEGNDLPANFDTVKKLHKTFGNTMTSTLWRFVEECHPEKLMLGIISQHPHKTNAEFNEANPCKYFIESPGFREKFQGSSEIEIFAILKGYCKRVNGGPLGSTKTSLLDANGERHIFIFESFSNSHEVLTLAVFSEKAKLIF